MLASASPRKPKVDMRERSSKLRSLDVANRSASSGRSDSCRERRQRAVRTGEDATYSDAAAIVLDLQRLEAAFLERDLDERGAGVETVLDELLERVGRPMDDLKVV